ncbi:L,D-transpeptidase family protein [Sedimentitalea sp. JM2-8]|uniref:L,D-transpeptidase family protein n=2 Tax=Sedimentitalea xiamensis TaxID=3050037 RepID=A0ABT7FBX6_9RHOB|nr:L,D-transpeptidase family protein [Sedimentitalea xiamensis]MDK3072621.1 L,D-transpeptidase family protein [Sedimentitalea xiamensis]
MALCFVVMGGAALAQVTVFKQTVAEAATDDADLAAYYRSSAYEPIWTEDSESHWQRRAELLRALSQAHLHGLPPSRYDAAGLERAMQDVRTSRDLGLIEVRLSKTFLRYARDVQTGVLIPSRVDGGIVREIPYRDRLSLIEGFVNASPRQYLNGLPPSSAQYRNLMKEKLRLESLLARGAWGPTVPADSLKPGQNGPAVIALRNRLVAMGLMPVSASPDYDVALQKAVRDFQLTHGLEADGVAGAVTLQEVNASVQSRLKSVIVAMERERWTNMDLGDRHIVVNQTDFSAKIVDHGRVTFETRSVIGKNTGDRRSPEFSDQMEHMIVNPSWYVPRSIVTKEYLPQLKNNPHAVGHIEITDSRGRRVDRSSMDFSQFSARSFPFSMRQPPSKSNALGLVKFMFPNKYNIYLHDTPSKNLFERETRAFSHGCIRLADPFDFAYTLLAAQTDDPQGVFQTALKSGRETKIDLVTPVPVHIIYRTAIMTEKGKPEYRRDVYGRDARIWQALENAGVALEGFQG